MQIGEAVSLGFVLCKEWYVLLGRILPGAGSEADPPDPPSSSEDQCSTQQGVPKNFCIPVTSSKSLSSKKPVTFQNLDC